jgi:hypothetical protein
MQLLLSPREASYVPEDDYKQRLTGWWRWPLVPVASIAAGFAGSVAFRLMHWSLELTGDFDERGWYVRYTMPVIQMMVLGGLWAYVATRVAPNHKIMAGVVMASVLGTILLCLNVIGFTLNEFTSAQKLELAAGSLGGIAGAVMGLLKAREDGLR